MLCWCVGAVVCVCVCVNTRVWICNIWGNLGMAAIAQLGERQTEDLNIPGSIPGHGTHLCTLLGVWACGFGHLLVLVFAQLRGFGPGSCMWFAGFGFAAVVAMPVWPR